MSGKKSTFQIQNTSESSILIVVEPEGQDFDVYPGQRFEIFTHSSDSRFVLEYESDGIVRLFCSDGADVYLDDEHIYSAIGSDI